MIYANKQGDEFIATNNIVWFGPYRIGSDGTTSGTGSDSESFNYIYCRT